VHIEKTSIDGFSTESSSCIRVVVTNPVRVFVDDSFLRHCRNGIYAQGSAVNGTQSLITLDNTRIERGSGPTGATGIWVQGCEAVTLRNSVVSPGNPSIPTVGVKFDSLLANCFAGVEIINTQIIETDTAVLFANTTANTSGAILLTGSQLLGGGIDGSNTAAGVSIHVTLTDSRISLSDNDGVSVVNSAANANSNIVLELLRSQILLTTTAINASASNGSGVTVVVRDSELSRASTAVRTGGGSGLSVDLVRSSVHNVGTAIDHHNGGVRLDGSHVVACANSFVNNGSASVKSIGNNMVECADTSGFTYITPTIVSAK